MIALRDTSAWHLARLIIGATLYLVAIGAVSTIAAYLGVTLWVIYLLVSGPS